MNMPSTEFLGTLIAREACLTLKAAKHPGISIGKDRIEMMDALYAVGLKGYSKDALEGIRTCVDGDSKIRTLLGQMEGGCSVVAVRKVLKVVDGHGRLETFSSRLIQSDIGRPLIPRTADKAYEHATARELQTSLRLVGIFTASADRGFLRETLRTAPGLLVTVSAIEDQM